MDINASDISLSYRLKKIIYKATGETLQNDWSLEDMIIVLCQTIVKMKLEND